MAIHVLKCLCSLNNILRKCPFKNNYYIYLFCGGCVWHVEVRGQLAGFSFFLPSCRLQRSDSGWQAWWHPLPTEPPLYLFSVPSAAFPFFFLFPVHLRRFRTGWSGWRSKHGFSAASIFLCVKSKWLPGFCTDVRSLWVFFFFFKLSYSWGSHFSKEFWGLLV